MIKQFSAGDITVRPFKTFKNWSVQSVDPLGVDSFENSTYIDNLCEISRGEKITTPFYPSGNIKYDPISEPMTGGRYHRIVYNLTDAMFYRNPNNPLETFGLESTEVDPNTGKKEYRKIHDKIVTVRINKNNWGEKIVPNSIHITDNSNLHETYEIYDDGMTNLIITGSHFSTQQKIHALPHTLQKYVWNSGSGQFYVTIAGNSKLITVEQAKNYMGMGVDVTYVEGSGSWSIEEPSQDFNPRSERFGHSVSAWYKYLVVGSPTDEDSLLPDKEGYVALYKYDEETEQHRLIKRFFSPKGLNGLKEDYAGDLSIYDQLVSSSFAGLGYTSSYQDGFGYSVSVHDDFLAIGSPTGSKCFDSGSSGGWVYVYDKNKGGSDNWGKINDLRGEFTGSRFGHSVSLDGDLLAVGAPSANSNRGLVYIYRLKRYMDSTNPCRSIPTSSFAPQTGSCGLPAMDDNGEIIYSTEPTQAFVSGNFCWVKETTLSSSIAQSGDNFGWSLELNNDRVLIGTKLTAGAGYATLFVCNYVSSSIGACPTGSWEEKTIFTTNSDLGDLDETSPDYAIEKPLSFNGFGYDVALNGNNMAICSYYDKAFLPYGDADNSLAKIMGAVYFYHSYDSSSSGHNFEFSGKTFGDITHTSDNNFGRKVAIDGMRAAISSESDVTYRTLYISSSLLHAESSSYQSESPQTGVLGRVSLYNINSDFYWDKVCEIRRNKEANSPFNIFGKDISLSSDFLAVGAPVVSIATPTYQYTISSSYHVPTTTEAINIKWLSEDGSVRTYASSSVGPSPFSYGPICARSGSVEVFSGSLFSLGTTCYADYDQIVDIATGSLSASWSGSSFVFDLENFESDPKIGNAFYKNGYLVVTNTGSNYENIFTGTGSFGFEMNYKGTHTIFEHEFFVSVLPGEFNYSTNPTSLMQNSLLFDVNGDGIFDLADVDLIMKYLNKKRFYEEYVFDDNGIVLEQSNKVNHWWTDQILLTEAGDVLLQESDFSAYWASSSFTQLTKTAFDYIENTLDKSGILDIDGDGVININDGAILVAYFSNNLTPSSLSQWTNENSTRKYVSDVSNYIGKFTGVQKSYTHPNFFSYQESSSYDPTGSYLAPYITTIGLYDSNQLVAVAKLGRPIKNLTDWPVNFVIRFDT